MNYCKICNSTKELVPLEAKIDLFTPQIQDGYICQKCLSSENG